VEEKALTVSVKHPPFLIVLHFTMEEVMLHRLQWFTLVLCLCVVPGLAFKVSAEDKPP
jgi:hypothetical protein